MSSRSPTDRDDVRRETERAREEAAGLASAAKEGGRRRLDEAKQQAADGAEQAADAIDAAADEMEAKDQETLSGYGRSLASFTRQLAGGLRERDIDEFAGELAHFARRNPTAFLASSVAVGFGFARFLRASSEHGRAAASPESEWHEDYDEELEEELAPTPGWTPEHAMTQPSDYGNPERAGGFGASGPPADADRGSPGEPGSSDQPVRRQ